MEKLEKVRKAPPKVGEFYLIPTIRGTWLGIVDNWPIIGPKHSDAEFFNLAEDHYHVDLRFVDPVYHTKARSSDVVMLANNTMSVVWQKRICHASRVYNTIAFSPNAVKLNRHYEGQTVRRGKLGWICPHKKVNLGQIQPNSSGVITCPLHGLRIDAKTGVCLGPEPRVVPKADVTELEAELSGLEERLAFLDARIAASGF